MAVVKADAYGHGLVAVRRGGAGAAGPTWLGTALARRGARAARGRRHRTPVLAWLLDAGRAVGRGASRADIDLSVSAPWAVDAAVGGGPCDRADRPRAPEGRHRPRPRRRAPAGDWPDARGGRRTRAGRRRCAGRRASGRTSRAPTRPAHPTIDAQVAAFARGRRRGRGARASRPRCGTWPTRAATLDPPGRALRPGPPGHRRLRALAGAGRAPVGELGLRPAMTLRARLALVKRVPGRPRRVVRPPLRDRPARRRWRWSRSGYADGIPRARDQRGPVLVGGQPAHASPGRVCMDQFVVDVGDDAGARRATRSCSSAPGDARRADGRRLGRRTAARSTTRSSPGSGLGCPASYVRREP